VKRFQVRSYRVSVTLVPVNSGVDAYAWDVVDVDGATVRAGVARTEDAAWIEACAELAKVARHVTPPSYLGALAVLLNDRSPSHTGAGRWSW